MILWQIRRVAPLLSFPRLCCTVRTSIPAELRAGVYCEAMEVRPLCTTGNHLRAEQTNVLSVTGLANGHGICVAVGHEPRRGVIVRRRLFLHVLSK